MSLRVRTHPGLGFIEPCLPSPAKAPPSGLDWIHEIKNDGFRIMARRDGASVRLITRHGNDFTSRFPFVVAAVTPLPARSLLIDGEAIGLDYTRVTMAEQNTRDWLVFRRINPHRRDDQAAALLERGMLTGADIDRLANIFSFGCAIGVWHGRPSS
jgi:hypothetical protein